MNREPLVLEGELSVYELGDAASAIVVGDAEAGDYDAQLRAFVDLAIMAHCGHDIRPVVKGQYDLGRVRLEITWVDDAD